MAKSDSLWRVAFYEGNADDQFVHGFCRLVAQNTNAVGEMTMTDLQRRRSMSAIFDASVLLSFSGRISRAVLIALSGASRNRPYLDSNFCRSYCTCCMSLVDIAISAPRFLLAIGENVPSSRAEGMNANGERRTVACTARTRTCPIKTRRRLHRAKMRSNFSNYKPFSPGFSKAPFR